MRPEQLLVDSSLYTVTGDRLHDLIMSAFAGIKVDDYNNEIELGSPERDWCNAVLKGEPMPTFDYSNATRYELCHLVFYATDFGRKQIDDSVAREKIMSESTNEDNIDLLSEYAVAIKCVKGTPTPEMIASINAESVSEHHNDLKLLFEVIQ